jgi:hypothetical protein
MSADGRGFVTDRWHEGVSTDVVYVEIHRAFAPDFHGWVDRHSRLLVQAG